MIFAGKYHIIITSLAYKNGETVVVVNFCTVSAVNVVILCMAVHRGVGSTCRLFICVRGSFLWKVLRRGKTAVSCKCVSPIGGLGDFATLILVSLQVSLRLHACAARERKAGISVAGTLLLRSSRFLWNEGYRRAAAGLNSRRAAGGQILFVFVMEVVNGYRAAGGRTLAFFVMKVVSLFEAVAISFVFKVFDRHVSDSAL